MSELFEIETHLSPYLQWIKDHHIKTDFCKDAEDYPWLAAQTDKTVAEYIADNGDWRLGAGDTEQEAIAELVKKVGIPPFMKDRLK